MFDVFVCAHDRETKLMKNGIKLADMSGLTIRLQMLMPGNMSIFPD